MVGLPYPYQGMYLLDSSGMHELINTDAGSPDQGIWQIREKAAQGLTFWNQPKGSISRSLVGVTADLEFDDGAKIHHLPNIYALNKNTPHGKIALSETIRPGRGITDNPRRRLAQKVIREITPPITWSTTSKLIRWIRNS
jgi:hypothetical protein